MKIKGQITSIRLRSGSGESPLLVLEVEVFPQMLGEDKFQNAYAIAPKLPVGAKLFLEVRDE